MSALVRAATAADAAFIAACANALNEHEHRPLQPFTRARVLEHGFGDDPAFFCLVGELAGVPCGYAMYSTSYDTDRAVRGLWLNDLYVETASRGSGLGRALFAAVCAEALRRGRELISWGVSFDNKKAEAFYRSLGASDPEARILELGGAALRALAEEGEKSL